MHTDLFNADLDVWYALMPGAVTYEDRDDTLMTAPGPPLSLFRNSQVTR